MKVAICGFGFSGATLPLGKSFAQYDCITGVDCYYFIYKTKKVCSIESLDYDNETIFWGLPHKIHKSNRIYDYLQNQVNVYLVPLCPNGPYWFRIISSAINKLIIVFFALRLFLCNYSFINIVAHTKLEYLLIRILHPIKKIIVSVHEIYETLNEKERIKQELRELSNNPIDIVFHSTNVRNEFEESLHPHKCRCHTIPFANFESYLSFKDDCIVCKIQNYILFIGSIQPYKGLSLFKKVLDDNTLSDVKVVIAGKGYVPELDYFRNRKNTVVINRYISNQELVSLIRKSLFVVCPYLAASQTGIAPTAFVFHKPLLATDVGAFNEIIIDGENGFLVNPNSIDLFRERLLTLYRNQELRDYMSNEIKNKIKYSWLQIAADYIDIFKQF